MAYIGTYHSPLGNLLLAADDTGLTGLWFEGQKYFARTLPEEQLLKETPVLAETRHWLNIYFSGEEPAFTPPPSSGWIRLPTGGVADSVTDSLWHDHDLWRDCPGDGQKTASFPYVCPGSRRRSRA